MTASIARKVIEAFHQQQGENRFDLTPRELETLSCLMKGMSYKMIADACNITFHTVNAHCIKIYEKLHVPFSNRSRGQGNRSEGALNG